MSALDPKEKQVRDELVQRFNDLETRLYPTDGSEPPPVEESARIREESYQALGEYSDRLPRMRLSVCPYCEAPLKRAFDPFGLDGPWWFADVLVPFEEPAACEHFRVLLGALHLGGRVPAETTAEVRPGPEAPFVVPDLLDLAGMIAVVGRVELPTGDLAYPVAYFADQPTRPEDLHQPWCRTAFWFQDGEGTTAWSVSNSLWDFDLKPHVDGGNLRWVLLDDPANRVLTAADGACPFLDLPGDREMQQLVGGNRDLIGAPTGEPLNPFG